MYFVQSESSAVVLSIYSALHSLHHKMWQSQHTPLAGTETTMMMRSFHASLCLNIPPRGDGNLLMLRWLELFDALSQHTPSRGRKPEPHGRSSRPRPSQHTPSRGRKRLCRLVNIRVIVSTYPLTGTETVPRYRLPLLVCRLNIPPHGDGNSSMVASRISSMMSQHTPSRGRKPPYLICSLESDEVSTYPLTGTETCSRR